MATASALKAEPVLDGSLPELPLVSVVVEGYNEAALATSVTDVLDGLAKQDYPLDRIELILVGTDGAQVRRWSELQLGGRSFLRVLVVDAEGGLYYLLKNRGAERASGEIIAFTDSDVCPQPGWVSSIVRAMRAGADLTGGISSMHNINGGRTPRAVVEAAAAISFGHVIGHSRRPHERDARALVAHNLAVRADVFRRLRFDTELGRNCSIALLYETAVERGLRVELVAGQRVAHSFSLGWFLYRFHVRVGWEEYVLRRRDTRTANRWMMRTGPLEPAVTSVFYVALDLRKWLTFGRYLGLSAPRRWARLPLVLAMSAAARLAGMAGMYAAMLFPRRSRAWAEAQ